MLSKLLLLALAASPLVSAHGKVAVMTGDMGGNTTGLGIQGGVVPGPGKNKVTEVDTTVFKSKNAMTDGLGKTKAGPNTLAGMSAVMAQSGDVLPQVSADGGMLSGTLHIVTTDGAGPYTAVMDTTGTGAFSQGTKLQIMQQVPGQRGNIAAPRQRRFMPRMLVKMGLMKRASNVNEDYPIKAAVPAGTTCTGTVGGQQNVCLVKMANPSAAGPFGGVIAFQMAGTGGAASPADAAAAAPAAVPADTSAGDSATSDSSTDPDTKRAVSAKFRL